MFGREPAVWLAAISAVVALGIGFGLPVTPGQFGLIMAAVAAVLGLLTRSQVAPKQDVQTALEAPAGTTPKQLEKIIKKQST